MKVAPSRRTSVARQAALACSLVVLAAVAITATAGARAILARTHYPTVHVMIVGKGGHILVPSRSVRVTPARIRVKGHACDIAGGTPLAALEDLSHQGTRTPVEVKPYSPCNTNPASAEGLLVMRIDGVHLSAAESHTYNGWVYKIGNRAGTAAAGSPKGPFGNGHKLATGQDVLWFWCVYQGEVCQRTLGAVPAKTRVAAGSMLTVHVESYGENGVGSPAVGARVTLGRGAATSGAGGVADVPVPSHPGRYSLTARQAGLVPSFERTITVTAAGG